MQYIQENTKHLIYNRGQKKQSTHAMAGKTRPINYILNTIKKDYIKQPRDQKYSWLQLQI